MARLTCLYRHIEQGQGCLYRLRNYVSFEERERLDYNYKSFVELEKKNIGEVKFFFCL